MRIFSDGLEKQNGRLGQSHFTYYARDAITVLKKQLILADRSELSTSLDYKANMPNAVYNRLG